MPDLERTVRAAVDLLVRGDYETLEAMTQGHRVSAAELGQAISDYGRTLIPPPDTWWSLVDVTPITAQPGEFHVAAPVWTAEEGRSDLTLELHVRGSDNGSVVAEILGLHVL